MAQWQVRRRDRADHGNREAHHAGSGGRRRVRPLPARQDEHAAPRVRPRRDGDRCECKLAERRSECAHPREQGGRRQAWPHAARQDPGRCRRRLRARRLPHCTVACDAQGAPKGRHRAKRRVAVGNQRGVRRRSACECEAARPGPRDSQHTRRRRLTRPPDRQLGRAHHRDPPPCTPARPVRRSRHLQRTYPTTHPQGGGGASAIVIQRM